MKPMPRHRNLFAKKLCKNRKDCHREYMDTGYDIETDGEKFLLRAINGMCNVLVSLQTLLEAKRHRPKMIIYDPESLQKIAVLDYQEWLFMSQGLSQRRIYYIPRKCNVKITLYAGREGRRICIVVTRGTAEHLHSPFKAAHPGASAFSPPF